MRRDEKIETFRALHHGPRILLLPNAWDAASARIFEDAGFPAIATTSAGVAISLGYADGQRIPRDVMLEAVARIVAAVDVPVTADLEAGYDDAVETARAAVDAGAVGLNLEDTIGGEQLPVARQAATIRAVRAETDLVINARTDVFLFGIGDAATRFARAVERLNAYIEAGADCAFAPGVSDKQTIGDLAREVRGPLNVLARPDTPGLSDLERLGVARVTVGSGAMRATMWFVRRLAEALRDSGGFEVLRDAIPYVEANLLMLRGQERGV
jgi:2-methylisocitrate lyase-like PEP mutase family enzyme